MANSSTSYSVNLSERFTATESTNCPISSFSISKVELESSQLSITDYVNWIGIGNNTSVATANDYYTNLVIKDLTKSRDKIQVTIKASNGYAVSPTSTYLVAIEIKEPVNTPPFFDGQLQNEVRLNYSDGSYYQLVNLPKAMDS